MKSLIEYISESLILERNEQMFPKKPESQSKFSIWIGDHGKQRMEERHVSEKEIIDAFFDAFQQLNKKFKDREISVSRDGKDSRFIIVDARKDKTNPVNISAFIYRNSSKNKLYHPSFTVRTVFKGDSFSGTTRKDSAEEVKIFLY